MLGDGPLEGLASKLPDARKKLMGQIIPQIVSLMTLLKVRDS
jgi:hypothetical protein